MKQLFFWVVCATLILLTGSPAFATNRTVTVHDRVGCKTILSQQKRLEALWRGIEADRLHRSGQETPASRAAGDQGFATLAEISLTRCTLLNGSFKIIETRSVGGLDMHKLAIPNSDDHWIWAETIFNSLMKLKLRQQSTAS